MSGSVKEVSGVEMPDSVLTQSANDLVHEVMSPALYNNGIRTYIFGSVIGRRLSVDHDRELFYVGALMHNLGLVAPYADERRFEVSGADAARGFVLEHGLSARQAERVWDAVALHTNLGIASAKGGEVALVHLGTSVDVVGIGIDELPAGLVDAVLNEYPRLQLKTELRESLIAAVRRNPEAYVLTPFDAMAKEHVGAHLPTFEQLLFGSPFDE